MRIDTPFGKHLVLIGGGHSHVAVLKKFGMSPLPGVRLALICRDLNTPYSGMLPGLIAGHYSFADTHIDVGCLAHFAGARFYRDVAVGVDLVNQRVLCRDHPPIPYDLLSIDIGTTPLVNDVPGATGNVVPVKPVDQFLAHWEKLCERVPAHRQPLHIGVVGGGAGGVEVLLAIRYRLQQLFAAHRRQIGDLTFHLLTDTAEILPTHNPRVRAKFQRILRERGVHMHTGSRVSAVEPGQLFCANGIRLELDAIVWVTQGGAAKWVADAGLVVDEQGFIQVNNYLQSVSHPAVFAAGDIATMVEHPRPKAGVFAVRQGPPLAANLRRALRGEPLKPYIPQQRFLSLISTGDRYAIASRSNWAFEGYWVWRWKDWIDRRFICRYQIKPNDNH